MRNYENTSSISIVKKIRPKNAFLSEFYIQMVFVIYWDLNALEWYITLKIFENCTLDLGKNIQFLALIDIFSVLNFDEFRRRWRYLEWWADPCWDYSR